MGSHGIDVNYALPWNKVKAAGVDFALNKVSQGVYFGGTGNAGSDPYHARANIRAQMHQGIIPGAYHWLDTVHKDDGSEYVEWAGGARQCDWFVAHLPGNSPTGLLCAVDVEYNATGTTSWPVRGPDGNEYDPRGYPDWSTIRSFVQRWFHLFPLHPLFIYSSRHMWSRSAPGRDVKSLDPNVFCWSANWGGGSDPQPRGPLGTIDPDTAHGWQPGWGGFTRSIIVQYGPARLAGMKARPDGDLSKRDPNQLLTFTTDRVVEVGLGSTYRDGFNTLVAAAVAAVPSLNGGAGDADYLQGVADARAAVRDGLPDPLVS